jgi:hypothetical protein
LTEKPARDIVERKSDTITGGNRPLAKSRLFLAIITVAVVLAGAAAPEGALALTKQPRPAYMVGVGWGMGRGDFSSPDGSSQTYSEGGVALMRFGRMVGSRAMVALNYSGWIIEFDEELMENGGRMLFAGDAEDSTIIKSRRSQQQMALSLYYFPGNSNGATGGLYVRAGAAVGWAGTNQVPITPGEPQGHGNRIDEWGWGVSLETGYEFWVSSNATIGLGAFYDYMSIRETIVDKGWFIGGCVNFNVYF